ncbi:alcohol dehydrogenase catalytic domain-containing protein [Brachybacterium sp. YJGR34]|uniref:alcohol dehydrogenase catalytic domain-containing protein n=1 Tax=Brachybacterium sp. YJGR34 TaxID=2059911 RepID=UPI000E09FE78|nr:alcohol dehydrogenase catalytic domain-containing protein [Brachybacterium sp. YJGR34]
MRAVRYDGFGAQPALAEVPDPVCPPRGAVIAVHATGVCRSDWHAWQGHDDTVHLPHIPGHEFAGVVQEVGAGVTRVAPGDRVTAPFILSCGRCAQCRAGATQVCPAQRQPGFDLPGSWAEQVVVIEADHNLVPLPDGIDMTLAAGLGCRVGTAYHAVRAQAAVTPGECVVVYGCGGLGLAAVQVARAIGAEVLAVDVSERALAAAAALGATPVPFAADVAEQVRAATDGGADVSLDALGSAATAGAALSSLRPRGRHVQVGLLLGEDAEAPLPMGRVIAQELQILGSHGLAAAEYRDLLEEIAGGRLDLGATVGRLLDLEDLPAAMLAMDHPPTSAGMTIARVGCGTMSA